MPRASRSEYGRDAAILDLRQLVRRGAGNDGRLDDGCELRADLLECQSGLRTSDEQEPHHPVIAKERRVRVQAITQRER